jgi:DNA-directed RNA polymerase subunit RPC12/RpoP
MDEDVTLVGSRVSAMHLAYDCLGCSSTVAVSITDGKAADGHRLLIQRPRDCPTCGERIDITVAAEAQQSDRVAR